MLCFTAVIPLLGKRLLLVRSQTVFKHAESSKDIHMLSGLQRHLRKSKAPVINKSPVH
jgi:hypothetical protein